MKSLFHKLPAFILIASFPVIYSHPLKDDVPAVTSGPTTENVTSPVIPQDPQSFHNIFNKIAEKEAFLKVVTTSPPKTEIESDFADVTKYIKGPVTVEDDEKEPAINIKRIVTTPKSQSVTSETIVNTSSASVTAAVVPPANVSSNSATPAAATNIISPNNAAVNNNGAINNAVNANAVVPNAANNNPVEATGSTEVDPNTPVVAPTDEDEDEDEDEDDEDDSDVNANINTALKKSAIKKVKPQ